VKLAPCVDEPTKAGDRSSVQLCDRTSAGREIVAHDSRGFAAGTRRRLERPVHAESGLRQAMNLVGPLGPARHDAGPQRHDARIISVRPVAIGVLHPGEMGAALGAALRAKGETVLWASSGRSAATAHRAEEAGLEDVVTLQELARRSDVVLAVCPPHAAVELARSMPPFAGVYVDANAVSPGTARTIAGLVSRYVDGGIVGPPPHSPGSTRLYVSGEEAPSIAALFAGTTVDARTVSGDAAAASAVKMAFAAWTKGTAALLLGVRAVARAEGVEATLLDEWRTSLPRLPEQSVAAAGSALTKGWRWVGEMNEIAETFAAAGLPDGFHRAAAEIYARTPRAPADPDSSLERVLAAIADAA
jgi:3-hydroxyisobutyrate dehydrogenase-like beta-hydroxyacid dehydrogenase